MHLKKLEIQGFKSFPEHTIIEFDPGMTAIVGPNGSGKSNVTDAIRWVLGEQSVRTLRGGKMEDVIFNGTQSRRAMHFAEVAMTIDNADGELGIDYAEVLITRRLHRSGESEYLINRVNCRLKDILSLFMDTGLGKDGYSIVGQGKVDDILSSRSEDRRKVIEEAAGIVKFKTRKEEAERKLSSSEQNLTRIADILAELESQRDPLAGQAQKAKAYHKIYDQWKRLDVGATLALLDRNEKQMTDTKQREHVLSEQIRAKEDDILKLRESNRDLTEASGVMEEQLDQLRKEESDLRESLHVVLSEIAVMTDRKKQLGVRIDQSYVADQMIDEKLQGLDAELLAQQRVVDEHEKQKTYLMTRVDDMQKNVHDLQQQIGASSDKLSGLHKQREQLANDIKDVRAKRAEHQSEKAVFDERLRALVDDRKKAEKKKADLLAACKKAKDAFEKNDCELLDVKDQLAAKETALAACENNLNSAKDAHEATARQLEHHTFRLSTLSDLEANREGFLEPVRRLMQAASTDHALKRAIEGVVGDQIRADKKYETAIEVALGASFHNVVTPTKKNASQCIDYLKQHQLGRVTFLPMDTIRPRVLDADILTAAKKHAGFVGLASKLVTCPDQLNDIIGNLLGSIIVVRDIKDAVDLSNMTQHRARIVSLEGDVIHPGGSMTGGRLKTKTSGVLSRARDMDDLKHAIASAKKELEKTKKTLDKAANDVKAAQTDLDLRREKLDGIKIIHIRAQTHFAQVQNDLSDVDAILKSVDQQMDEASKRRLYLDECVQDDTDKVAAYEAQINKAQDALDLLDDAYAKEKKNTDAMTGELYAWQMKLHGVEASLKGARELLQRIQQERQAQVSAQEAQEQSREDGHVEKNALDQKAKEKEQAKKEVESSIDKLLLKKKECQLEKQELEQALAGFIDLLSTHTSTLSSLQGQQIKEESRIERIGSELDEWKNRMWEDHELTYDTAQTYRLDDEKELPDIQKTIGELRIKMKQLGTVNLAAIDEFEKLTERMTFLHEQKEDVMKAKAHLEAIIDDLVCEMKSKFKDQFARINDNFRDVFTDLFGGGTAEIAIDEEQDILYCPIEIRAQPPGKKLQSLSLLSGGEKCLTAIALLFAILQLKPSPFCVLDEVEVALDDINVSRFTEFVRRYATRSQFIMVTHRKGTMEACDRIYGVTMQERGISKILSMRMGEGA